MELLLDISADHDCLNPERFNALCNFLCRELNLSDATEVSLSFIANDEMRDLNFKYRGKDAPTDVLSFECDGLDDDFPLNTTETHTLGDIVIATDVALSQARDHCNTPEQEIDLLITHGFLHLCGYDHIDEKDAEIMEPLQDKLLNKWHLSV